MSQPPICGTTSPVRQAILSIVTPPGGVDPAKLAAATAYVNTQLQPIVASIEDDISSVISTNYLVLLFIALIAILVVALWICAVLAVEGWIVIGIVLLILIVSIAAFFAFQSYVQAAVNRTLQTATSIVGSRLTASMLLSTLNGAAQAYLATIGISC